MATATPHNTHLTYNRLDSTTLYFRLVNTVPAKSQKGIGSELVMKNTWAGNKGNK